MDVEQKMAGQPHPKQADYLSAPDREIQKFLFEFLPRLLVDMSEHMRQGFSERQIQAVSSYFQGTVMLAAIAYPHRHLLFISNPTYKRLRWLQRSFLRLCDACNNDRIPFSKKEQMRDRIQDESWKLMRSYVVVSNLSLTNKQKHLLLSAAISVNESITKLANIGLESVDRFVDRTRDQDPRIADSYIYDVTGVDPTDDEREAYRVDGPAITTSPPGSQQRIPSATSHVVVLVHGIRTHARWYNEIRTALKESGLEVEFTNYGRFDLFRFLIPLQHFRRAAVGHVFTDVRAVLQNHPDARISFIAHSFGTYIVSEILKEGFDFQAHRIVFCGSIVPNNFRFEQLRGRFTTPILNEVGTRDVLPILAESVTWGYGSGGAHGLRRPNVVDRWHSELSHSGFLNESFCKTFWIPFIQTGQISEGDRQPEKAPWYFRILLLIHIKYFMLAMLLVLAMTIWLRAL